MPKTVVAIRHVHFEDLGIFAPALADSGYAISYRDAGVDDLRAPAVEDADLLAVLGGPIGAYEDDKYPFLTEEIALIEQRLAAGRPTLGICLGAQLMARALGQRVYPGPAKEIGWAPVNLTEAGRAGPLRHLDNVAVLHWHGDTFDLPDGADRLASTAVCLNQAFAIGANALALQFHPEVEARTFERWLIGHAAELAQASLTLPALRADTRAFAAAADRHGRACLDQWLQELRV
ncbi:glutamine amidotransferase [Bradyrhizobium sp. U87765 SZCCT0131]|uniref:glutamine amidotransferase n=1 Tax=unclassified Bradyrhizobium TaxID=2631580 RepID=UPI001BA601CD|nr:MULTISPECIES: glutamine amidotransferase [unclassified Bradyrhizobium]MBR1217703.1 glutamine amidotransferase [Bradyrhizobium sp. U87765 SZCCT0131]MBR1261351.1 glutamine amidotransferase [Bradyrhizobium sp. U87765 SZCCT0134]MBR1303201.1 glutamine amidotransferase [Bradyrhizobium sp. U87765 SZCCT0110]MBR1318807.1 glutamine amidotransferase [Bradyrhizobium sp. U87765 SZCCT0109]MBR1347132.1 glutamine amidotransferase [Bradyrhizobium sp. U87765 SZCCT0048]